MFKLRKCFVALMFFILIADKDHMALPYDMKMKHTRNCGDCIFCLMKCPRCKSLDVSVIVNNHELKQETENNLRLDVSEYETANHIICYSCGRVTIRGKRLDKLREHIKEALAFKEHEESSLGFAIDKNGVVKLSEIYCLES